MVKKPEILTTAEMRELALYLDQACKYITKARLRFPLARHIQYPKIPSILSESIVAAAISKGHILCDEPINSVTFGGKQADLIARLRTGGQLKIEVKASGPNGFVSFGPKDYSADYLIWLLFGNIFVNGAGKTCRALILPKPGEKLISRKRIIAASKLIADWPGTMTEALIKLPLLSAALKGAQTRR